MPLQLRRGTEAERTTITPVVGEPLYTTDGKKLFIGDGSTAGGVQIGTGTVTSITPAADLGSGTAITSSGTLSILGTANEVETAVSGTTVTVGLPSSVNITDLNVYQIDYNTIPTGVTDAVARQYWDATWETLTLGLDANVSLKHGQQLYLRGHNSTGSQINRGSVVYVAGGHATTEALIALADADAEGTSANTVGIAAENIAHGSTGFVQVFGYMSGLATNGYAGSEGSALYLSSTAGEMTSTLPVAPKHGTRVGFIVKKAGAGAGSIFINVQNYQELEELSDVFVSAPAGNDALFWDSVDQRWENSPITLSKLSSITALRLVGRNNASAGSPEEISLGTGLKMSGTVLSANTSHVVSTSTSIIAGTGLTGGTQTLAANVNIGVDFAASGTSSSTKAVRADDSRLSDSRTPTTHKTSHATGGTDAIAPADIGAAAVTPTFVTVNDETATLTNSRRLIGGGAVTINTGSSGLIQVRRAALTGDVTAAENNNTLTIANNAVTETKIADGAVTMAKIAQAGATSGQVIKWNGSAWAPGTDSTGGGGGSVATDTIWDAAGDLAVGSGSDTAVRLARGSAGQVLTVNSGGTDIEWATPAGGGGGTKTYAFFTPLDAQPPATNFATLDTRNSIAVLEFDGGSTDESTTFVGVMPEAASLGSGLKVRIHWMADTATSGDVRWGVAFERMTTDLDTDDFGSVQEGNGTANGTSGIPTVTEITITTIDSIAAGDAYRLKVYREASDTGNDTMSGDAQLIAVEVRSAA